MDMGDLKKKWRKLYEVVPAQLKKSAEVERVATAFNTNIDAVLKISGQRIAELAKLVNLSKIEIESGETQLKSAKDVVRGIIKCFSLGIAEEWITDDKTVYEWMKQNLGYDRLQMGGQGGIVANALAVLGVQKVIAHTNSHPKLQAEQFLPLENLHAVDEEGKLCQAVTVNREQDTPLVHWIIEFDKGDSFEFEGLKFVCPKANRFIATYDPANIDLVVNQGFVEHLNSAGYDYLILSGYHNLTEKRNGVKLVNDSVAMVKKWRECNPNGIIHLELASTQDIKVRRAVIEKIAPLADSIGMNERETLDALEVVDEDKYKKLVKEGLSVEGLFDAVVAIKKATKTARLQLHMFGLYITVQDRGFKVSPEDNLRGMMLAATVAATKAGTGKIERNTELLWAHGQEVADISLQELSELSQYIKSPNLLETGIARYDDLEVIALPTIIVEKPLTLVGMGDTISSISLVGAR